MKSALFLDLGGTLLKLDNDEIYLSPEGSPEVLPQVKTTLRNAPEELLFIVTNQSGIGKGWFTHADVRRWIDTALDGTGKTLTDFWACPTSASAYRKPSSAMVAALIDKHHVDPKTSTFVGDTDSDRACATAAGLGKFIWAHEYFNWSDLPSPDKTNRK